jgi:V8-like Glu-specific endopeptidase
MASMRVGTPEEAMLQKQAQQNLHARLLAQQVELGVKNSIVVNLSDEQRKSLTTKSEWPLRVGVVAPVAVDVTFDISSPKSVTDDSMIMPYGAVRRVGKEMVWTTSVIADKATGIRLFITGLDLPAGAELAIYNQRGEAFSYTGKGPFGNGELWTNTVTGSVAYLQLTGTDLSRVSFTIGELGYLGDNWVLGAHSSLEKAHCSYNETCVQNAGCGIDQAAADATDAVAYMLFVKKPYIYTCSGGLINNDAGRPYFLTANHCISRDRDAGTLEAYFFYAIGCNDPCPDEWSEPNVPRVLGSTVAATNRTSDYTILELSGAAPAGTVMLGWDATDIAFADGVDLYRISHPATAPQAYSTHVVDTSYGVCGSWPRGAWIYSRDTYGATEGGSSGSPVVNSDGKLVGQLSGGCGTNINDVCDWASNATVDGAFAAYYNEVAGLLGGGGCVPTEDPEVSCSDGIDNDCDGLTDDADPDCGGGECLPKGATCTLNSECCSLQCHPIKGTCK